VIGDRLIFEDHHRIKALDIVSKIKENIKFRFVVCIGGYSGTGKSETATPDEVFRKMVLEKEREDILETKPLANMIIKYKES